MGKKEGKGKAAKGPPKPESMSDEEWSLYNNVAELVMNLRGQSPQNTVQCLISRGQAAMYLWQHACSSSAKLDEIVQCGAIPQAIIALKQVDVPERPAVCGLLNCMAAASENAREQLVSLKPVYPNPSINLLGLLWNHLGSNSPATETNAVGCLCHLAVNQDTRSNATKELTHDPSKMISVMENGPSAQARAQAALFLKACCTPTGDNPKGAEATKRLLVAHGGVEACVRALRSKGAECTSARRDWVVPMMEHVAGLLQRLLVLDACKTAAVQHGAVEALASVLAPDTRLPAPVTFETKSAIAACLALVTLPTGFEPTILDDLSRVAKLQIGSGGPPALRKAPSEADADEEDFTPPGTPPDDTDLERVGNDEDFVPKQVVVPSLTEEEREARKQQLLSLSKDLEDHVDLVAKSGVIAHVVSMLKGPEPEEGGGKKKKGKKEPPMPPGMAECQQFAAQCVRHLALVYHTRKHIVEAGAVPMLTKLCDSKIRSTRQHARGALLSLGVDDAAVAVMKASEVPEHILMLSNQSLVEEVKAVAEAEREAKREAERDALRELRVGS